MGGMTEGEEGSAVRVLVADDEEGIRDVIREYLEFDGHTVTEAANGAEAVALSRRQDFDVIVMDIMMPVMDGFAACAEIRKGKQIPVLMLSARGEEYDKLRGFQLGIDDYVVKPFSPKELMARLGAITARAARRPEERAPLVFGGLEVDLAGRTVRVDGQKAPMTPRELDLLFHLVRNRGIALSREQLLARVWGTDFLGDDRTVDTHVKMLRSSLGPYRGYIATVRGVGYKFEAV